MPSLLTPQKPAFVHALSSVLTYAHMISSLECPVYGQQLMTSNGETPNILSM